MPSKTTLTEAETFYEEALGHAVRSEIPFMVGGAYAMREYACIARDTKDLDIFCKAGDFERLLQLFGAAGYRTEITDASWIAKAFRGEHYVDLIFNSGNRLAPVDDTWFEHARRVRLLRHTVRLVPPEEVLWSKMLVQERHRFDGADVLHVVRKMGPELDWSRLLQRMEPYWEVLLAHIELFRFVYPSERDVVPRWLMDELLARVARQLDMPTPVDRVCRGPVLSRTQYQIDITEWGYKET